MTNEERIVKAYSSMGMRSRDRSSVALNNRHRSVYLIFLIYHSY